MEQESQVTMEDLKTKTLLLIAQRLLKTDDPIDIYNNGKLETEISYAVTKCKRDIGQVIIEVLEMKMNDIKYETIVGNNAQN